MLSQAESKKTARGRWLGYTAILVPLVQGSFFPYKIPTAIYYGSFLCFAILAILMSKRIRMSIPAIVLIFACLASLTLQPSIAYFQPWWRLACFIAPFSLVGPLLTSEYMESVRYHMLKAILYFCALTGPASLVGYLFHFPLFSHWYFGFHGICSHSLVLATYCMIGVIYFVYMLLKGSTYSPKLLLGLASVSFLSSFLGCSLTATITGILSLLFFLMLSCGKKLGRLSLALMAVYIFGALSEPLWANYTVGFQQKIENKINNKNISSGRDEMLLDRWNDFCDSPLFGAGFATIRHKEHSILIKSGATNAGGIEPGPGWPFVLSTIGLLGLLPCLWYATRPFLNWKGDVTKHLRLTLLLFVTIHSFSDGYILSGGNSNMFIVFWLVVSSLTPLAQRFYAKYNLTF